MIDIFVPPEAKKTLCYALALKDADQKQTLRDLPQFDHIEESLKTAKMTKPEFEDARVDLHIRGQGPSEDPFMHNGFGRFEIRND